MKHPRRVGFTGTRSITAKDEDVIAKRLRVICRHAERVITGACVGVDAYIAHYVNDNYPDIVNVIVVPSERRLVDNTVLGIADAMHIHMAQGTTYRQRNEMIVSLSEVVEAFWTGDHRSGTKMTIGIARREGKLGQITILER